MHSLYIFKHCCNVLMECKFTQFVCIHVQKHIILQVYMPSTVQYKTDFLVKNIPIGKHTLMEDSIIYALLMYTQWFTCTLCSCPPVMLCSIPDCTPCCHSYHFETELKYINLISYLKYTEQRRGISRLDDIDRSHPLGDCTCKDQFILHAF